MLQKSLDEEISSLFSSETVDIELTNLSKTRIKVLTQLLSTPTPLLEQKSITTLSNFIKNSTKSGKKSGKTLDTSLLSLICTTISKSFCLLFNSNEKIIEKDSFKPLQTIIQNFLKYISFLKINKLSNEGGVYLALNEIMKEFGNRVQSKLINEIIELSFEGLLSNDDTIGMLCGSLLSSCCLNSSNFTLFTNRLLLTIQNLLNLCYATIKDEGKIENHKLSIISDGTNNTSSLLVKQTNYSNEEIGRLFKFCCFSLSKLLSSSFSFIIQINIDSIIQLILSTLLLDSKTLKFQNINNHPIKKTTVKKVIPIFHNSILLLLNISLISFKSYILPYSNNLSLILIEKLKIYKNIEFYHQILNSICLFMSVIGYSKLFSFEIFPILIENLKNFNTSYRCVIESRIASSSEQKKLLSLTNEEMKLTKISTKSLTKLFSFVNVTFIDLIPKLTELTSILINLLKSWNDYKNIININDLVVDFYELLQSTLLYTSTINTQSPFINISISLFRIGILSGIQSISSISKKSLNLIETNLHPRSAPLYIPHAETIEKYSLKRKLEQEDFDEEHFNEKKRKFKEIEEIKNESDDEDEDEDEEEMESDEEDEQVQESEVIVYQGERDFESDEEEEVENEIELASSSEDREEGEEEEMESEDDEERDESEGEIDQEEDSNEEEEDEDSNEEEEDDEEEDSNEEEDEEIILKNQKFEMRKTKKDIDFDLESIESDDPSDDERDISDLKLKF
eukprot:gene8524-348_t